MWAAPRKRPRLTPRDKEICARLGPELKKRGLIFAGIDVIGDYLTEINVTSPTGIRQVQQFGGRGHRGDDLGRDREEGGSQEGVMAEREESLVRCSTPIPRPSSSTRDIDATMATMGEAPHVTHVPTMTGGNGRDAVRRFYETWFIGHWPEIFPLPRCPAPKATPTSSTR